METSPGVGTEWVLEVAVVSIAERAEKKVEREGRRGRVWDSEEVGGGRACSTRVHGMI